VAKAPVPTHAAIKEKITGIVQEYREAIQDANEALGHEPIGQAGEQLHKSITNMKEAVQQANAALGRESTGSWWEDVHKLMSVGDSAVSSRRSSQEERLAELVAEFREDQERMKQTYCLDHPWDTGKKTSRTEHGGQEEGVVEWPPDTAEFVDPGDQEPIQGHFDVEGLFDLEGLHDNEIRIDLPRSRVERPGRPISEEPTFSDYNLSDGPPRSGVAREAAVALTVEAAEGLFLRLPTEIQHEM
jgi:hypothetical protein